MWFYSFIVAVCVVSSNLAANAVVKRSFGGVPYEYNFPIDVKDKASIPAVLIHVYCDNFRSDFYRQKDDNADYKVCGGTLLGDQYVITAAHCFSCELETPLVTDKRMIRVFFGGTCHSKQDLKCSDGIETVWQHPLHDVVIHPQFSMNNPSTNDIAIIKLYFPLPNPSPITLFIDVDHVPYDTQFYVSGFGKDLFNPDAIDHRLQTVQIVLERCPQWWQRTRSSEEFYEKTSFDNLCSVHRDADVCEGDSGSGLVDENNVLYGIASSGIPCDFQVNRYDGPHGLYIDVSKHIRFICTYTNHLPQCIQFFGKWFSFYD